MAPSSIQRRIYRRFGAGAVFGALCCGRLLLAQSPQVVVVKVSDPGGTPIPFAVVRFQGAADRLAGADGIVVSRVAPSDSLRIRVRRIGFAERQVVTDHTSTDTVRVWLEPIAGHLTAVTVSERANTPLARTGFYDRMQRVQRGAIVAEFITPEELNERNVTQVSQILHGRSGVRVDRLAGGRSRAVLLGRGGTCGMTIIVDGQRVSGTLEEQVRDQLPQNLSGASSGYRKSDDRMNLSVDEIVDAASVAAIEIYPSLNAVHLASFVLYYRSDGPLR